MPSVTVTIPIPKYDQNRRSKNALFDSGKRKADVRKARIAAGDMIASMTLEEEEELGLPWDNANLHILWYHRTKGLRDVWNIIGCLKPTIDAFVRIGILKDDDKIPPPTVERLVDPTNPRVEIVITKKVGRFKGVL